MEEPQTWEWVHKWIADRKREVVERGETPWTSEQMQNWMGDCKYERIERQIREKSQKTEGEDHNETLSEIQRDTRALQQRIKDTIQREKENREE